MLQYSRGSLRHEVWLAVGKRLQVRLRTSITWASSGKVRRKARLRRGTFGRFSQKNLQAGRLRAQVNYWEERVRVYTSSCPPSEFIPQGEPDPSVLLPIVCQPTLDDL